MKRVAPDQPLTFNRMREINLWTKAFAALQWCLVPFLLLTLLGISNRLMWRLGENASLKYPKGNPPNGDWLYASWHVGPAIFYAAFSMVLAVLGVRFVASRVWRQPSIFRPWLRPAAAAFDFLKLAVATAATVTVCFYLTFLAESRYPNLPGFLRPPSTQGGADFWEWAGTRGVQFALVSVVSLLIAQHGLRMNRHTILPSGRLFPVLVGYTVLFEAFYSLSRRFLAFPFYGPYEQGRSFALVGPEFLVATMLLLVFFGVGMVVVSRRVVRPSFPVDCNVVLAGASKAGKTRFFGEALLSLAQTHAGDFDITLDATTEAFLARYEQSRKSWFLPGTQLPARLQFSIETQDDEKVRFNWQDIPGGVVTGGVGGDDATTQEWKDELYSANALCVFFDCELLVMGALQHYPHFRKIKSVPVEFVRQLKQRDDFERPPVICVIGTKIDRLGFWKRRRARARLEEFARFCRGQIKMARLPRSQVGVRLTSTMINASASPMPANATDASTMPFDPEQRNCAETLMWVAAKILEAKSLGLDGPAAALLGKATPFGEIQIDLERLAS